MNISGVIIVLAGTFIFIVGIRGTQANVFPWFFHGSVSGSSGSAGGGSSGAQ